MRKIVKEKSAIVKKIVKGKSDSVKKMTVDANKSRINAIGSKTRGTSAMMSDG